ncbi:Hypothetical protein PHPALM_6565 [Phytophthora palmivora]|uniref:Retrotransposon gag domain-containing protein n=1 Tax=Phytophthora palmivora TaxID=4796 RepID=A0A2P4YEJ8_9STRA|nr:Hypothetical protein PHPALM_6565 [Phytophthora palmivora]
MTMDATADGSRSVQFEEEDAQGHASDEEKDDEDYEEKVELVERNLAAEFGEDADDEDQGAAQGERPPLVPRATRNADTPSANKVLAQLGGEMMRDSEWMKLFAPVPKITMMKTTETKKGERFRATAGTPYFEDSHMLSPKKSQTRLGRNKWESECNNSAEADDSDGKHGYRPSRDETVKDQIYHLSNDRGDQGGSQYLELRSHVSLEKIAQFDGRQYRSDDSLQWLKRFIYEMKDTPFLDYYCSLFDQSTRTRYYSAKRKDKETICDFLTRLNGYARTAKIQYERGGADAADHVERFLQNCGGDDIMDMLYPLRLNDIRRVEQIINKKILGEKRKKQRDRLISGRSRDELRRDDRLNDQRRDDKRDTR